MLRQSLSQKILQKLSPQQIQLIKLLQVPTVQLEARIKEELEINPALEEGKEESTEEENEDIPDEEEEVEELDDTDPLDDDVDLTEYMGDDEVADYKLYNNNRSGDDDDKEFPNPIINSFHDQISQQLNLLKLDEKQTELALQIIGSIDEDGYLTRPLVLMVDDLIFSQNLKTTEDELAEVLKLIQTFDPPGVGARDLQESLSLQLERKDNHDLTLELAKRIINNYYNIFIKKQYDKLMQKLSVEEEGLKAAMDLILKLDPKPGGSNNDLSKSQLYVVPDFTIVNEDNDLILSLHGRNAPELHISSTYRQMLKSYNQGQKGKKEKEAVLFIKQKLDAARWFIDAIKQRQNTLQFTMQAILDYQEDFFLTGDETKLRPMILKDIANITGLDISTISRVSNSKYVSTEFGTFSLKFFFSESLTTTSGEEISSKEVKQILKDLINDEDSRKPLSDQQLTEALKKKGYEIARRTVAKYREQLNFPVARLRKEL